ncbi:MAG: BamA/TamA family outer membrane protein [Cytophagales bacterium]|nr:BamA/TamA family outer membrane protein [Cytophagales bacterium]
MEFVKNFIYTISFTVIIYLTFPAETNAQALPSGGGGDGSSGLGDKNFNFVPVPYLNYSRSIGFAFGALPMAMYNLNPNDTISPASISGLLGMYTTNDTWFAMFFQRFYLKEDNWRLTAAGGLGSVNFQFYLDIPGAGYIDYNTQADFFFAEIQRRIIGKLYAGIHYTNIAFDTSFGSDTTLSQGATQLQGLGIKLSFDKRDDVYYPRGGSITEADWTSYPGFLDNEFKSDKIEIDHNQYFSTREDKDVIAARLYGGFGIGELSFEQQFVVGQQDIRGYTQGKYRGDYLLAAQGEYRWNFHKKLSAVGFFGFATVYGSINTNDEGVVLPGIGTGIRYNVFPKYHMNVGIDVAAGKDDWGFYFRIGEAF